MSRKISWAAALLVTTCVGAMAQTPAPSTATPPTPAAPMAASPATVPEKAPATSSAMAPTGTASLSKADKKFVMVAASGGLAEVQAAQLAQQKAQDPKVKAFAEKMITDHTENNKQLASLAEQKGVTVPTAVDAKDQKQLDKLGTLDGAKFDKAYMKDQVRDHTAMLKLMKKEASSGKDADLKSFADQTATTVQQHLDMAKAGGAS